VLGLQGRDSPGEEAGSDACAGSEHDGSVLKKVRSQIAEVKSGGFKAFPEN
jgi:hypothetical protein